MSSPTSTDPNGNPGYELSDAKVRPLLLFGAGLTILIVGSMWFVQRLDTSLEEAAAETDVTHPMEAFRKGPEEPLLQAVPATEMEVHREQEQRLLSSYGWVDRSNGVARIPIERALQLMGEAGSEHFPTKTDDK